MDGLTATRLLRGGEAGERNRQVVVLAMTAHALESFRKQCEEAGMNGFLPKPVGFQTLADALASLPLPPAAGEGSSQPGQPDLADLDRASEMLGGQEELLADVVRYYLGDLPEKRRLLADALERGDLAALRLTAHSLKSTSASVGAAAASRAARVLEELADAALTNPFPANPALAKPAPPDPALASHLLAARPELAAALASLDALLEETQAALAQACDERFCRL